MDSRCILSNFDTALVASYFYEVLCVSLRMTTERPETAHIVAGPDPHNIAAAVETVSPQTWDGRYDLEEGCTPSSVVINRIRSRMTNFV